MREYVRQRLAQINGSGLTFNQRIVLLAMRDSRGRRELYEGALGDPRKNIGSGQYFVTYSGSDPLPILDKADIDVLLNAGMIKRKWPDLPHINMFVIA